MSRNSTPPIFRVSRTVAVALGTVIAIVLIVFILAVRGYNMKIDSTYLKVDASRNAPIAQP